MEPKHFVVESFKPFSESLIWSLNRDYYEETGIDAWRQSKVPHYLTSNSMVGKTYAELILGFLKDLAAKGQIKEKVYILELGAGHGRLAFHILKHLDRLISMTGADLPEYCYVLSDIVEGNLDFFQSHPQFESWFEKEQLDVAYFDAMESKELVLRNSGEQIVSYQLEQPVIAIANYFFDSIPNDLFWISENVISTCSVALTSQSDPHNMEPAALLESISLEYQKQPIENPFYEDENENAVLEAYGGKFKETHILFPHKGLKCLRHIQRLSNKGLLLLSLDKGFSELKALANSGEPEIITHGSFSVWVNFHALGAYCEQLGGKAMLPEFSSFHLQLGCLQFLDQGDTYKETQAAYTKYVDDFGSDDLNTIKKFTYQNIQHMGVADILALMRLNYYDSTFFENILPGLKVACQRITIQERRRLAEVLHQVWEMYFTLGEPFDLGNELAGVFYDLAFYREALFYFGQSMELNGAKPDIYYNQALCFYQLRQDKMFQETIRKARSEFPDFEGFSQLDKLDLSAQ